MTAQIEEALTALARDVGPDTVTDLIDLYVVDAPRHVADIGRAVANRDTAVMRRAAHSLKSTAAMVGALPLADTCREIERLAREEKLDEVGGLLEPLFRQDSESRIAVAALRPQFAAAASS